MASKQTPPTHMLSKRKSLNDDLIIWRGMAAQNLSVVTAQGLPFSLRRRKLWLDIVAAEVEKKAKSIVAQNFAFSTRPSVVSAMSVGRERERERGSLEDEPVATPEARLPDILAMTEGNLPIRIDSLNEPIVRDLAKVVASEIADDAEAGKVLSFILYREQIPSNRRACVPTGPKAHAIYTDVLDACLRVQEPAVHKHLKALGVPRDVVWALLRLPVSEAFPLVLRVRVVDLVLVKGCHVLVSIALALLARRHKELLRASTAAQFLSLVREPHSVWLPNDALDAFWQRCAARHNAAFLDTFLLATARSRNLFATLGRRQEGLADVSSPSSDANSSGSNVTASTVSAAANASSGRRSHSAVAPLGRQHARQPRDVVFDASAYDWIGFDVDHTLVEYKLPALLRMSFEYAAKELQRRFIGLRARGAAEWRPEIARRGVAVDTARGNFLHVTENGTIQHAFHGSHEVSYYSVNLLYGSFSHADLLDTSTKLIYLNTAADIVFAPLYAWIVDAFDSGVISSEELGSDFYLVPDIEDCGEPKANPNDPFLANQAVYVYLSSFALNAARSFYASVFWKTVCGSPEALLSANVEISVLLETLKDTHKRALFVLTNGSWTHCDHVMSFAVGKDWRYYFELVLTDANKDIFFDDLNDTPFYEVPVDDETAASTASKRQVAAALERGGVYSHGNAKLLASFFHESIGPTLPDRAPRVCYFGDHLVQDILKPAQHMADWDLVAVIKELQLLHGNGASNATSTLSWPSWLWRVLYGESPLVSPDLHSTFFFLGTSGAMTLFGRRVCDAAVLCLPSVGVLARTDGVLRMATVQHGWSASKDLVAFSKRMTAKVRAIRHSSSTANLVGAGRRTAKAQSASS